jgi:hypothetical protein
VHLNDAHCSSKKKEEFKETTILCIQHTPFTQRTRHCHCTQLAAITQSI